MKCERCGSEPQGEYGIHEYCAVCSKNLCDSCMAKGCCGKVPAISGTEDDTTNEDIEARREDHDIETRGESGADSEQ